jgi:hypothetical protein
LEVNQLIEILKKHLSSDLVLLENKSEERLSIRVLKKYNYEFEQENFIELKQLNNGSYQILEHHRKKEYIKAGFDDGLQSICAFGIFAESFFGKSCSDETIRLKIKNFIKNSKELNELLKSVIGYDFFSINSERQQAINLVEINKDNYHLFYLTPFSDKVYISKDRTAPSAFVVLYNYAVKLKWCSEMIEKWDFDVKVNYENQEKIRRLVLGR